MPKYKALILDLDGTTVQNDPAALPSQRVVNAIHKAHKKLSVCIATGRPIFRVMPILDILAISHPVILLGGSLIIDGISRKIIYEQPMQKTDITQILAILKPYKVVIKFDLRDKTVVYNHTRKLTEPILNMLVVNISEETADDITDKVSHISTIAAHKILSWTPGFFCLNIAHASATKQHAIFEVAKRLKIETHEIIGVGDGPNDFPLLMACGFKVAMSNAVSDLKAIADYIAPSIENDGVADVIERFVLTEN